MVPALLQYALAVSATENQARFHDIRENQYGLGFLGKPRRERIGAGEHVQCVVGVLVRSSGVVARASCKTADGSKHPKSKCQKDRA